MILLQIKMQIDHYETQWLLMFNINVFILFVQLHQFNEVRKCFDILVYNLFVSMWLYNVLIHPVNINGVRNMDHALCALYLKYCSENVIFLRQLIN